MVMLHIQLKGITECSSMVANILPTDNPTLGMGSVGQNSTFSEHGHVAYQTEGNQEMQQHGSKYFARKPPYNPQGMGSVGQNSTFSEHGHAAYQIKENHKCSNMVANILPTDPALGMASIGQTLTFSEHGYVACPIKGIHEMQQHGNKYFAQRPLPDPTPLTLGMGSVGQLQLYQNMVMLHIKIKRIKNAATW